MKPYNPLPHKALGAVRSFCMCTVVSGRILKYPHEIVVSAQKYHHEIVVSTLKYPHKIVINS